MMTWRGHHRFHRPFFHVGRSSSTDGTSLRTALSLSTGSTAAGGAGAENGIGRDEQGRLAAGKGQSPIGRLTNAKPASRSMERTAKSSRWKAAEQCGLHWLL